MFCDYNSSIKTTKATGINLVTVGWVNLDFRLIVKNI